jgi:predicted nucleic-acid-binding protein
MLRGANMVPLADANIILRYILNDHRDFSAKAKEIIDNEVIEIPTEVLCEVIYVLSGVYSIGRIEIRDALKEFFETTRCVLPHRAAILRGLDYYAEKNLDFVDSLLAGYAVTEGVSVKTFDDKLQKLLTSVT